MTNIQKHSPQIPSHVESKGRDRTNSGTDVNADDGKSPTKTWTPTTPTTPTPTTPTPTTWTPAMKKKKKVYSKLHLTNELDYVLHARLDQIERILITAPKKAHNQYKVRFSAITFLNNTNKAFVIPIRGCP